MSLNGTCTASLGNNGKWSFTYSGDCWSDSEGGYDFSQQAAPVAFTLSLSDSSGRLSFTSDGMTVVKHKDKGDKNKWKKVKDFGAPFSNATISAGSIAFSDANNDGERYNFCCQFTDSSDPNKVVDDPIIINKT